MQGTEDQDVDSESEIQDSFDTDESTDEADEDISEESNSDSEESEELEETDSDLEEEEQSDEDQDDLEEKEEESPNQSQIVSKLKDPKTGNFDWNKINKKVGSSELQKVFVESQKAITRFGQEKSAIEKEYAEYKQSSQETANNFQIFERLYDSNPKVRAAIDEAVGVKSQQSQQGPQEFELPQGVDPNDPVIPVLRQQQQMIHQLNNHYQSQVRQQQQAAYQAQFYQGLDSAKQTFTQLVGRAPTEAEIQKVSQKMQQTRHLNGAEWVPGLFIEEIRKGAQKEKTQDHRDLKKLKRDLPKTAKKAVSPQKTVKERQTREDSFNEMWEKYYGR